MALGRAENEAAEDAEEAEADHGIPLFGKTGELASRAQECVPLAELAQRVRPLRTALASVLHAFGRPGDSSRSIVRSGYVRGLGEIPQQIVPLICDAASKLDVSEISAAILVREFARRTHGGAGALPSEATGATLLQLVSLLYEERIALLDALRSLLLLQLHDPSDSNEVPLSQLDFESFVHNIFSQLGDALCGRLLPFVHGSEHQLPEMRAHQLPHEQLRLMEIALLTGERGGFTLSYLGEIARAMEGATFLSSTRSVSVGAVASERQQLCLSGLIYMLFFQQCCIASAAARLLAPESHETDNIQQLSAEHAQSANSCVVGLWQRESCRSVVPALIWALTNEISSTGEAHTPLPRESLLDDGKAALLARDCLRNGALEELTAIARAISSCEPVLVSANTLRRRLQELLSCMLMAFEQTYPGETDGNTSDAVCTLLCTIYRDSGELCYALWSDQTGTLVAAIRKYILELRMRYPAEPEPFLNVLSNLAPDDSCASLAFHCLQKLPAVAISMSVIQSSYPADGELIDNAISHDGLLARGVRLPPHMGGIMLPQGSPLQLICGVHGNQLASVVPNSHCEYPAPNIDGIALVVAQLRGLLSSEDDRCTVAAAAACVRCLARILCANPESARYMNSVDAGGELGYALATASARHQRLPTNNSTVFWRDLLDLYGRLLSCGLKFVVEDAFSTGPFSCDPRMISFVSGAINAEPHYFVTALARNGWMPALENAIHAEIRFSRFIIAESAVQALHNMLKIGPSRMRALHAGGFLIGSVMAKLTSYFFPDRTQRDKLAACTMRAVHSLLTCSSLELSARILAARALSEDKRCCEVLLSPLQHTFDSLHSLQHMPSDGFGSEECDQAEGAVLSSLRLVSKLLRLLSSENFGDCKLVHALLHDRNDGIGPRLQNVAELMNPELGVEISSAAMHCMSAVFRFVDAGPSNLPAIHSLIPDLFVVYNSQEKEAASSASSSSASAIKSAVNLKEYFIEGALLRSNVFINEHALSLLLSLIQCDSYFAHQILLPDLPEAGSADGSKAACGLDRIFDAAGKLQSLDNNSKEACLRILLALWQSDDLSSSVIQHMHHRDDCSTLWDTVSRFARGEVYCSNRSRLVALAQALQAKHLIRSEESEEDRTKTSASILMRNMNIDCLKQWPIENLPAHALSGIDALESHACVTMARIAACEFFASYDDLGMSELLRMRAKDAMHHIISHIGQHQAKDGNTQGQEDWQLAVDAASLPLASSRDAELGKESSAQRIHISDILTALDCHMSLLQQHDAAKEEDYDSCFMMNGPLLPDIPLQALGYDEESRSLSLGSYTSEEATLEKATLDSCEDLRRELNKTNDALVTCRVSATASLSTAEFLLMKDRKGSYDYNSSSETIETLTYMLKSGSQKLNAAWDLHEKLNAMGGIMAEFSPLQSILLLVLAAARSLLNVILKLHPEDDLGADTKKNSTEAGAALQQALQETVITKKIGMHSTAKDADDPLEEKRVLASMVQLSQIASLLHSPQLLKNRDVQDSLRSNGSDDILLTSLIDFFHSDSCNTMSPAIALFFARRGHALSAEMLDEKRLLRVLPSVRDNNLRWIHARLAAIDDRSDGAMASPRYEHRERLQLACNSLRHDPLNSMTKPPSKECCASACIDLICGLVEADDRSAGDCLVRQELSATFANVHLLLSSWIDCKNILSSEAIACSARAARMARVCFACAHSDCQLASPGGLRQVAAASRSLIDRFANSDGKHLESMSFIAMALAIDVLLALPYAPPGGYGDSQSIAMVAKLSRQEEGKAPRLAQQRAIRLQEKVDGGENEILRSNT